MLTGYRGEKYILKKKKSSRSMMTSLHGKCTFPIPSLSLSLSLSLYNLWVHVYVLYAAFDVEAINTTLSKPVLLCAADYINWTILVLVTHFVHTL